MSRIHCSPDTTQHQESILFPKTTYSPSLFTSHQLKTDLHQVREVRKFQPDWILGILILCAIFLAWTQIFAFKRFKQVIRAPFSKRFINQLMRDGNLFRERISISLGLIYMMCFSLLLYEVNELVLEWTIFRIQGFLLFLLISGFIIAFWSIKSIFIRILGEVFRTFQTTHEYMLNSLVFNLMTGIVILPFLIMVIYLKSIPMVYFCLIFMVFLNVFRFVRGFLIGVSLTKFSYLFLFVYLCSLEILPLLIIAKLLINFARSAGA